MAQHKKMVVTQQLRYAIGLRPKTLLLVAGKNKKKTGAPFATSSRRVADRTTVVRDRREDVAQMPSQPARTGDVCVVGVAWASLQSPNKKSELIGPT